MKKIKAIISLTLVCLMLIPMLVSCNKDGAPDGYKLVASEGDKFRLFVPSSWISNTESGITGAYSTVDENASVCVYMIDGYKDVAIGDYWAECDENYKTSFSEYKLDSLDEKSSLGGKKAILAKFSAKKKVTSDDIPDNVDAIKEETYKYIQVISSFEGEIYTLIFGANEEMYNKYVNTVEGSDDDGEFAGIIPYFEFSSDPYYPKDEKKFSHKVEAPEGMKLASTEERPYRFFVPESWQTDYRSALSAAYFSDSDKSNVSVQGHMLGIDDMSLEDYWRQSEQKYINLYGENYKLIESDSTLKMGKNNSARYTYTIKSGENEYKVMQVFCVKGAMAYIFTYTSTPELFDSHMDDVNKMLDAFTIR